MQDDKQKAEKLGNLPEELALVVAQIIWYF